MKATILSFRRGIHTQNPRQMIIKIEGIEKKEDAEKYIGKELIWKSPGTKIIKGKISASHGNKGLVRAIFERGLPGQAVNDKVEIKS